MAAPSRRALGKCVDGEAHFGFAGQEDHFAVGFRRVVMLLGDGERRGE